MVRVIKAGFYNSIQDLGRAGYRNLGVPISGIMDSYSAKLANRLLNNDEADAVLEITMGSCKLKFEKACLICLTGGDYGAHIDGESFALNRPHRVRVGSILSFEKHAYGVRSYLAISGGFQTEVVLGSRSWYPSITSKQHLKKGMILPSLDQPNRFPSLSSSVKIHAKHFEAIQLDCSAGPEFELLSHIQKEQLLSRPNTISNDHSRMGYKLTDNIPNNFPSLLTSAVLPGTVQLTPSGRLIVLMRDCQVTGGYPRVLQLTEHSINRLAQKMTGHRIIFELKQ